MPPLALPREVAVALGGALLLAVLWHLSLPGWFYHTPGTFLEGPLPAIAGATVGVWLHQADFHNRRGLLLACAWAVLGSLLSVAIGGTLLLGPWQAAHGLDALMRTIFRIPFLGAIEAIGSPYLPYALWMAIKTLLLWGAIASVAGFVRQFDMNGRLREQWANQGEKRAFSAEQRRQWEAYRHQYMAAVKAGGALPAAPASLAPMGGYGGPSWHGRAKIAYWALRIGIAIAGLLGLYTALQQQLFGLGAQLLFPAALRGLFGSG